MEKAYFAGGLQHMMVVEEASTQAKEMKSKGHGNCYWNPSAACLVVKRLLRQWKLAGAEKLELSQEK